MAISACRRSTERSTEIEMKVLKQVAFSAVEISEEFQEAINSPWRTKFQGSFGRLGQLGQPGSNFTQYAPTELVWVLRDDIYGD